VNRAGILRGLDRRDDALVAVADVIERFEDDQDETIQQFVTQARDHQAALLEAPDPEDDTNAA
jgi:hypothetical protein